MSGERTVDSHGPIRSRPARWALGVACGGLLLSAAGIGASPFLGRGEFCGPPLRLDHPRITVVKSLERLYLFEGASLVRSYPVRLGLRPDGRKLHAGDGRTPEGVFRIVTKKAHSPNRRFLGISYPDLAAVERGLAAGLVTDGEAIAIRAAHARGECPSWTTALGGGIGLHGSTGAAGPTAGCIALSDEHIDELFQVLRPGDVVEVLP